MSNDADWADLNWVKAVMLFPRDVDSRQTYCDIRAIKRIRPDTFATIDYDTAQRLARAANDGFGSREVDSKKHGYVVGQYVFTLYAMHRWREQFSEPSARKVIKWIGDSALGAQFKDGTPVSHSPQAIKDYIEELEDVAHLLGAWVLYGEFNRLQPFKTREELNEFLGVARMLEQSGCEFKQQRTKARKPLLNANTLWRVPESIVSLTPRWTVPPERLIKAMRSYRARPRR